MWFAILWKKRISMHNNLQMTIWTTPVDSSIFSLSIDSKICDRLVSNPDFCNFCFFINFKILMREYLNVCKSDNHVTLYTITWQRVTEGLRKVEGLTGDQREADLYSLPDFSVLRWRRVPDRDFRIRLWRLKLWAGLVLWDFETVTSTELGALRWAWRHREPREDALILIRHPTFSTQLFLSTLHLPKV